MIIHHITSRLHRWAHPKFTVFYGTVLYTFLQLVWKPLVAIHSNFWMILFGQWASIWSRRQHMTKSEKQNKTFNSSYTKYKMLSPNNQCTLCLYLISFQYSSSSSRTDPTYANMSSTDFQIPRPLMLSMVSLLVTSSTNFLPLV